MCNLTVVFSLCVCGGLLIQRTSTGVLLSSNTDGFAWSGTEWCFETPHNFGSHPQLGTRWPVMVEVCGDFDHR